MPAPIDAPMPSRIKSKTPNRRTSPSPELARTAMSAAGERGRERSADEQKRDANDDDEEEDEEDDVIAELSCVCVCWVGGNTYVD